MHAIVDVSIKMFFWDIYYIILKTTKSTLFEESRRCFTEITPFVENLGPRILLQIYPFLSEIMDERGVVSYFH